MKILKSIFTATLMLGSSIVSAACGGGACTDITIDKLYVDAASGTVYIGTSGDEKLLDCQALGNVYVTLVAGGLGNEGIYSTLLAAKIANKKIEQIRVLNGSVGCTVGYVVFSS
jgi:hypothetical protein